MANASQENGPAQSLSRLADRLSEGENDEPAVIAFTTDDCETWSRKRIGREARRLSAGLRIDGLEKGETVLLLSPASPRFVAAVLAILRAGGVVAPIDIQMNDEHLAHVFENSEAKRVFATAQLAKRLAQLEGADEKTLYVIDADDDDESSWKRIFADDAGEAATVSGDDAAVLFYTSGTTGRPKGVPLSHDNLLSQIHTIEKIGLVEEGDRMLLPLPLHHVYPVVLGILVPLTLRVPIAIPHALTGGAVTRALRESEATVILGVPRLYRAIFNGIRDKFQSSGRLAGSLFAAMLAISRLGDRIGIQVGRKLFRSVHQRAGPKIRALASGGSPLDPVLARNLEALGWPVAVGYGLTETSPLLTIKLPGQKRHESVGKAVEGVELKIDPSVLDGRDDSESESKSGDANKNKTGELLARGPNVFSGYHRMPEETREAFQGNWFRTGDLAWIDEDGFVYLKGRVSTMIVMEGGENVDPEKVEQAYEKLEEVEEIGVVEDSGKLAALVAPGKSMLRESDDEKLAKTLRQAFDKAATQLPSYQRVRNIQISKVPLERTRLGKLRRKSLAEAYNAAKEGKERDCGDRGEPIREEEMTSGDRAMMEDRRVRELWKLLAQRYPDKRLSPDSRMEYDLGVDSLEWVELSLAIEDQVNIPVDESLYQNAVYVRDLLEAVAERADSEDQAPKGRSRRILDNPESVISESERHWASPRGIAATLVSAGLYGIMYALIKLYFRVEARGLENVPKSGSFILTPNHISMLDAPALSVALGYTRARICFWAGLSKILHRNAFWRGISRLGQVIPIKREEGPMSSLSFGALTLKRGHALVWFPQAGLSADGRFAPFRKGIGLLLEHYSSPVIPAYIEGTDKAMPPGKRFPRPAKVSVRFGEAIDVDNLKSNLKKTDSEETMHSRLAKHLENTVATLGK